MHAPSTRSAATRRRRRAIGVVALGLGLVATLQGTDIAAALGAGSDGTDGPVSTDPGASSLLESLTSVMDLGIIVGALVASAAAGAFVVHRRIPGRLAVGAVLGGIMMGYGARIAFGCNIGAYFGGIASFSLHGWLWGVMALVGTLAGLALRPLFGLTNPKPTDSVC